MNSRNPPRGAGASLQPVCSWWSNSPQACVNALKHTDQPAIHYEITIVLTTHINPQFNPENKLNTYIKRPLNLTISLKRHLLTKPN